MWTRSGPFVKVKKSLSGTSFYVSLYNIERFLSHCCQSSFAQQHQKILRNKAKLNLHLSCDGAALSSWVRSVPSSRSACSGLWPPTAACCSTPSAPTPRLTAETNRAQTAGRLTQRASCFHKTTERPTHPTDSCPVGVFCPKPAPHSSRLVLLLMNKHKLHVWIRIRIHEN